MDNQFSSVSQPDDNDTNVPALDEQRFQRRNVLGPTKTPLINFYIQY